MLKQCNAMLKQQMCFGLKKAWTNLLSEKQRFPKCQIGMTMPVILWILVNSDKEVSQ